MKTIVIISTVLAASQCMPEPSGPDKKAQATVDASAVETTERDAGADADADAATSSPEQVAQRLLQPGPAPFSVPTARVQWPQQNATLLAPRGAVIERSADGTRVVLGEGRNFAYLVRAASEEDGAFEPPDAPGTTVVPREDGAAMWYRDGRWFFRGTFDRFTCWNADSAHHRDDVEMMIASCKSVETTP